MKHAIRMHAENLWGTEDKSPEQNWTTKEYSVQGAILLILQKGVHLNETYIKYILHSRQC